MAGTSLVPCSHGAFIAAARFLDRRHTDRDARNFSPRPVQRCGFMPQTNCMKSVNTALGLIVTAAWLGGCAIAGLDLSGNSPASAPESTARESFPTTAASQASPQPATQSAAAQPPPAAMSPSYAAMPEPQETPESRTAAIPSARATPLPPPAAPPQQAAASSSPALAPSSGPAAPAARQQSARRGRRTPPAPPPQEAAATDSEPMTTTRARELCWMATEENAKLKRDMDAKIRFVEKCVDQKLRAAGQ